MKIVEIKWGDAWIQPDDFAVVDAKKLEPVVRSTIGYLVSENSKAVVLCTDFFEKDKKTINTPMIIPVDMIIDYWEYELIPEGKNNDR
jgi:hypothetical protein